MDNETILTPETDETVTKEIAETMMETTAEPIAEATAAEAETVEEAEIPTAENSDKPWNTPTDTAVEVIYDGDKPWQATVIEQSPAPTEATEETDVPLEKSAEEATENEIIEEDFDNDGRPEEDTGEYVSGDKPWQCKGKGTIAEKYAPADDQDKPWK